MLVLRREYLRRPRFHVACGPSGSPDLIHFRLRLGPGHAPLLSWTPLASPSPFAVQPLGPGRVRLTHSGHVLDIDARPDGATHCQVCLWGDKYFRVDRSEDRAHKGTHA